MVRLAGSEPWSTLIALEGDFWVKIRGAGLAYGASYGRILCMG